MHVIYVIYVCMFFVVFWGAPRDVSLAVGLVGVEREKGGVRRGEILDLLRACLNPVNINSKIINNAVPQ